ncbi:MAG: hypothetical protein H2212_20115 [Ruminococcus sp.]|nr:hypothetical protein [Ruminococcus sp.]
MFDRAKLKSARLKLFIKRVKGIWASQPEISEKYSVIPSPYYGHGKGGGGGKISRESDEAIWIIIITLLMRALTIKVDSKRSSNFTKKTICQTERFESTVGLVISFIFLTGISYLLTSGILSSWILDKV